jgi:two-component system NtrC family sensor kinase
MIKALLGFAKERLVTVDSIPAAILLDRLAADVRDDATARGIEVYVEPTERDLPPLLVSTQEMHEALMHLLRNALDATAPGGTVVLHARRQQRDNVVGVELTVRDSGAGIPRAFLERIFDPFFTTKAPGKGVGLGLSLARQSIESHGGRIDVHSAAGRGTSMRVWLPTAMIAAHAPPEPESAARGEPESAARGEP